MHPFDRLKKKNHVRNHPFFAGRDDRMRAMRAAMEHTDEGKFDLVDVFSQAKQIGIKAGDRSINAYIQQAAIAAQQSLDVLDWPLPPRIEYNNARKIRYARHDETQVVDAEILFNVRIATVSGLTREATLPVHINAGQIVPPSMMIFEDRMHVLAQSTVDTIVRRNTSYYMPPLRRQFQPPLRDQDLETAVEARNLIGWQARETQPRQRFTRTFAGVKPLHPGEVPGDRKYVEAGEEDASSYIGEKVCGVDGPGVTAQNPAWIGTIVDIREDKRWGNSFMITVDDEEEPYAGPIFEYRIYYWGGYGGGQKGIGIYFYEGREARRSAQEDGETKVELVDCDVSYPGDADEGVAVIVVYSEASPWEPEYMVITGRSNDRALEKALESWQEAQMEKTDEGILNEIKEELGPSASEDAIYDAYFSAVTEDWNYKEEEFDTVREMVQEMKKGEHPYAKDILAAVFRGEEEPEEEEDEDEGLPVKARRRRADMWYPTEEEYESAKEQGESPFAPKKQETYEEQQERIKRKREQDYQKSRQEYQERMESGRIEGEIISTEEVNPKAKYTTYRKPSNGGEWTVEKTQFGKSLDGYSFGENRKVLLKGSAPPPPVEKPAPGPYAAPDAPAQKNQITEIDWDDIRRQMEDAPIEVVEGGNGRVVRVPGTVDDADYDRLVAEAEAQGFKWDTYRDPGKNWNAGPDGIEIIQNYDSPLTPFEEESDKFYPGEFEREELEGEGSEEALPIYQKRWEEKERKDPRQLKMLGRRRATPSTQNTFAPGCPKGEPKPETSFEEYGKGSGGKDTPIGKATTEVSEKPLRGARHRRADAAAEFSPFSKEKEPVTVYLFTYQGDVAYSFEYEGMPHSGNASDFGGEDVPWDVPLTFEPDENVMALLEDDEAVLRSLHSMLSMEEAESFLYMLHKRVARRWAAMVRRAQADTTPMEGEVTSISQIDPDGAYSVWEGQVIPDGGTQWINLGAGMRGETFATNVLGVNIPVAGGYASYIGAPGYKILPDGVNPNAGGPASLADMASESLHGGFETPEAPAVAASRREAWDVTKDELASFPDEGGGMWDLFVRDTSGALEEGNLFSTILIEYTAPGDDASQDKSFEAKLDPNMMGVIYDPPATDMPEDVKQAVESFFDELLFAEDEMSEAPAMTARRRADELPEEAPAAPKPKSQSPYLPGKEPTEEQTEQAKGKWRQFRDKYPRMFTEEERSAMRANRRRGIDDTVMRNPNYKQPEVDPTGATVSVGGPDPTGSRGQYGLTSNPEAELVRQVMAQPETMKLLQEAAQLPYQDDQVNAVYDAVSPLALSYNIDPNAIDWYEFAPELINTVAVGVESVQARKRIASIVAKYLMKGMKMTTKNSYFEDDESVAAEIAWYAMDRPMYENVAKNMRKFQDKGQYDHDMAVTGWLHLIDRATSEYAREFGDGGNGRDYFPSDIRQMAAEMLATRWENEQSGAQGFESPEGEMAPTARRAFMGVEPPRGEKQEFGLVNYMPPAYDLVLGDMLEAEEKGFDSFPRSYAHVEKNYILRRISTCSKDRWFQFLVNDGFVITPYSVNRGRPGRGKYSSRIE